MIAAFQAWKSDGTVHAGRRRRQWSPALNRRNIQWHCGNIQKLGFVGGVSEKTGAPILDSDKLRSSDKDPAYKKHHRQLLTFVGVLVRASLGP